MTKVIDEPIHSFGWGTWSWARTVRRNSNGEDSISRPSTRNSM